MGNHHEYYNITTPPLRGIESLSVGSRIVIWDNTAGRAKRVGKVVRVHGTKALMDDYIQGSRLANSNTFTERVLIDLVYDAAILPIEGVTDLFAQRYTTYALPVHATPTEFKKLKLRQPKADDETAEPGKEGAAAPVLTVISFDEYEGAQ